MNYRKPLVEKIDIFYILKQPKMVTRSELLSLLPAQQYREYAETYYRRRFVEIFERSYNKAWFLYRYMLGGSNEKERMPKIHTFTVPTSCLVIDNIHPDIPGHQLCSIAGKCLNLEKYQIVQRNSVQRFFRACYLILKEGANVNDSIEFMNSVVDRELQLVFEKVETKGLKRPCIEAEERDQDVLKSLFRELCLMHKIGEEEALERYKQVSREEVKSAQFLCNALRDMFLYCYTCGIQYDSSLDMMISCKNHRTGEAARRRREFLAEFRELFHPKIKTMEEELDKMMSKVEENHYKCEFCGKAFQALEFIRNHFSNKHEEELREMEKKISLLCKFANRVDCFMVSFITGADDEHLPRFVRSSLEDPRVVYDMGALFSGEIVMDKEQ
jgi:hypothetical protein